MRTPAADEPSVPEDADYSDLDPAVREELRSLVRDTRDVVGRHLVVAGHLLDLDPALALAHARAARRRASRIAVVREAVGITAYAAGEFAEALSELRAVRRMTGTSAHLPLVADCERALGRPEKALDLARSPEADTLDAAGRIELLLVAAGARRDLGQLDAAVVMLQVPELRPARRVSSTPRLRYAYADLLEAAGRTDDARHWFSEAAAVDPDGETDAADRLLALDGITVAFPDDDDDDDAAEGAPTDDGGDENPEPAVPGGRADDAREQR